MIVRQEQNTPAYRAYEDDGVTPINFYTSRSSLIGFNGYTREPFPLRFWLEEPTNQDYGYASYSDEGGVYYPIGTSPLQVAQMIWKQHLTHIQEIVDRRKSEVAELEAFLQGASK